MIVMHTLITDIFVGKCITSATIINSDSYDTSIFYIRKKVSAAHECNLYVAHRDMQARF